MHEPKNLGADQQVPRLQLMPTGFYDNAEVPMHCDQPTSAQVLLATEYPQDGSENIAPQSGTPWDACVAVEPAFSITFDDRELNGFLDAVMEPSMETFDNLPTHPLLESISGKGHDPLNQPGSIDAPTQNKFLLLENASESNNPHACTQHKSQSLWELCFSPNYLQCLSIHNNARNCHHHHMRLHPKVTIHHSSGACHSQQQLTLMHVLGV